MVHVILIKKIQELWTFPWLLLTALAEQGRTLNVIIAIILTYDLLDPFLGTLLLNPLVAHLAGVPRLLAPEVLEHEDEVKAKRHPEHLVGSPNMDFQSSVRHRTPHATGTDPNQGQYIPDTVIAVALELQGHAIPHPLQMYTC